MPTISFFLSVSGSVHVCVYVSAKGFEIISKFPIEQKKLECLIIIVTNDRMESEQGVKFFSHHIIKHFSL